MMPPDKQKRLNQIETQLTPREWAILLADEMRQSPSQQGWMQAVVKEGEQDTFRRAFEALNEQPEIRLPGNRPENIHARNELRRKLRTQLRALYLMITGVNRHVMEGAEIFELKANYKLSTLHVLILQDAFGQLRSPLMIEEWRRDAAGLIAEVFTHQAAVRIIQDKYFGGHSILFRDFEARMERTITTIREGAAIFNEYLKTSGQEEPLTIDMKVIEDNANRREAARMVENWTLIPRTEAMLQEADTEEAYRNAWKFFEETSL